MTLARIVRKRNGKSHYERKKDAIWHIFVKKGLSSQQMDTPPSFTQKLKIETRLKAVWSGNREA